MLAFADYHKKLLVEMWQFVKGDNKKYPLSTTMLGMSFIVIDVLRSGRLNALIHKFKSVIKVANQLYFGLLYKLYRIFKDEGKDIG